YPKYLNEQDFVVKIIQETGVIMVPGSAFGSEGEGYVRIALVQESETLQQALQALKTFKYALKPCLYFIHEKARKFIYIYNYLLAYWRYMKFPSPIPRIYNKPKHQ